MLKLVMCKGLPASGKTTWAKELISKEPEKWKRINKDDLRAMMDNSRWSKKNEKFVLDARDFLVTTALLSGFNVIVDDTNLAPKHEESLRRTADMMSGTGKMKMSPEIKVEFEIKDFTDVPLLTCIDRDIRRTNSVGRRVITQMYKDFIAPKFKVDTSWDATLSTAIMCDLDGTLCLFDGNPYDRDFLKDQVNEPVRDILKRYAESGHKIIFISGRSDKFRKQTEEWLKIHDLDYAVPFMRKDGDIRKDVIIKQEIFENEIKGKYNVLFVLDDRNQVVEFWRSQGITCLQVADGDF